MRITWVGVPEEARKEIRKNLRERGGREYIVCSEKSANIRCKRYIRESLWAFKTDFIAKHTKVRLPTKAVAALERVQGSLCESANELVFALLRGFHQFCEEAISLDGRGHFLAGYDGNEIRVDTGSGAFYAYRID